MLLAIRCNCASRELTTHCIVIQIMALKNADGETVQVNTTLQLLLVHLHLYMYMYRVCHTIVESLMYHIQVVLPMMMFLSAKNQLHHNRPPCEVCVAGELKCLKMRNLRHTYSIQLWPSQYLYVALQ